MRTKLAILTAAALAAGALSSQAQSNVYSLNVVGYVNVSLTNGFNLIANPLDSDGTGTNNGLVAVLSNSLPPLSQAYKFVGGGFVSYLYNASGHWQGGGVGTATLNPGEGLFVNVPVSTNITFVGQVLQGSQTNHNIAAGYSMLGSIIPLSGGVQTSLQYTPAIHDQVYLFGTVAGYVSYLYSGTRWLPSEPQMGPGTGIFLLTTGNTWVQNFTVQ